MISDISILFMSVSAAISIGLPIFLLIYVCKRYDAKLFPFFIGMFAFILFALVLESSMHAIVFANFALKENPPVYIIYAVLAAGIFEESARFLSFNFLKKKYGEIKTALSYGVGHGGTEAILIAGASMINAVIYATMINSGRTEEITAGLQGVRLEQVNEYINTIATSKPYIFLLAGIERIFAICLQICLSVFVFYSVDSKKEKTIFLFPTAILIHAATGIAAAAYQVKVLPNVLIVEAILALSTAVLVFFTFKLHDKLKGSF
jgi:uncharacterized membrane protein YhfC